MSAGASLRRVVTARAVQVLTSRRVSALRQRLRGRPSQAEVFLRLDDPYSLILAQCLEDLRARFDVEFAVHMVDGRPSDYEPEPQRLVEWAKRDARSLAELYDLDFPRVDRPPDPRAGAALQRSSSDAPRLVETMLEAWNGAAPRPSERELEMFGRNTDRLFQLGHYMPATIHYGGEWYWGIDRLNHLERRLAGLGLAKGDGSPRYVRRFAFLEDARPLATDATPPLELFWSIRSPYSYLALDRTFALADAYGLALQIRPVLPMVMRNLQVPTRKKFYILHDSVREGRWLGIDIGHICDPVGLATERCYALVDAARRAGRLRPYLRSFARAVWSRGVDGASDRGLESIVRDAGLPWDEIRGELRNEGWRERVEENRRELLATGLWGVPTLRFGHETVWGQDRFWALEATIRSHLGLPERPETHASAKAGDGPD